MPIRKETIERTAICYWSAEDDCFVVESPLFPRTAGVGRTATEAWKHYAQMLDPAYTELALGRVHGFSKAGRPAKQGVVLSTRLNPRMKKVLVDLSTELGVSIGEAIEYLCFFYSVNKANLVKPSPEAPTLKSIERRLASIERIVREEQVKYKSSAQVRKAKTKKTN